MNFNFPKYYTWSLSKISRISKDCRKQSLGYHFVLYNGVGDYAVSFEAKTSSAMAKKIQALVKKMKEKKHGT